MKPQSYEINVDTQKSINHSSMEFSQNNLNISELIFNITEDEKVFPLNDTDKIIVYFKKPDKTVVFQDKEIEILDKSKGKIKVLLTSQTLVRAGDVNGEISIERVENGTKKRASTYGFSFKVRSSIASNDSIESTNEFQVFDQLLELGEQDIPSIIASKETAESALAKSTENTNQIGILSGKTDERPGVIPPPNNFPWRNPPIMIKKDIFGRFNVVFDIEKFVPAVGTAYYVDVNTGLDTNTGLSPDKALKSLNIALQKADARVIYIAPGVYDRSRGWIKQDPKPSTLVIKPLYKGDIIIGTFQDGLTWAAEGTDKVYKAARSLVVNVYDSLYLDEYGDHKELIKKASIAEVSVTPGSWFTDGTSVFVRLKDDRVPDNTVKVYVGGGNGWVQGTKTIYMEGLKFYGGDSPFETLTTSAADNMNIFGKNCEFKYGTKGDLSANGLTIKGARLVILQNCIAAQNQRDGFNYHVYTSIVPNAIEIDCIGYKNGVGNAENNNNGSTMHDSGNIIRVNGIYFKNKGPNVVDVGNSKAWNVGCVAYESLSTTISSNVNFQNQDGKMWLDGCVSYDSNVDVSVAGTGVAYARRTLKSNQLFETPEY
ncbi:hypothetical protein COK02_18480 [Bacillus cereus]|nr:hypothetical protein COK02_18480 [Bacillus cereus]